LNKNRRSGERMAAAVLAALLIAVLLSPAAGAAISTSIRLAVNDELLSSSYGVEINNGVIYVPVTAFTQYLNCSYSYDAVTNVLMIERASQTLTFNLGMKIAIDTSNRVHNYAAYYSNGAFMLPAEFTASALWLKYSYIGTGPIVRIYTSRASLSNTELYNKYFLTPSPDASPAGNSGSQPSAPAVNVYMSFDGINESTADICAALGRYRLSATFFVDSQDVLRYGRQIVYLQACGHSIAVRPQNDADSYPSYEECLEDIDRCASLLRRLIKTRPDIVRLPCSESDAVPTELIELLRGEGYRIWDAGVEIPSSLASGRALSRIKIAAAQGSDVTVTFDCGDGTAVQLAYVIPSLRSERHTLTPIEPTDPPMNSFGAK